MATPEAPHVMRHSPDTSSGQEAEQVAATTNDVGSCWALASDTQLEPVKCGSGADYEATAEVTDPQACPDGYIKGRKGHFLCLAEL